MAKYDLQPNMQIDIREDLSPVVKKLSENTELPLFSKLNLMRGTGSAKAIKHEYLDTLMPSQITLLDTTINDSTTTVVLDLFYNGVPVKVLKGQEFEIEATDGSDKEIFYVTAAPVIDTGAKTITCTVTTRGYKSSTAAGANAGVRVELISTVAGDGTVADDNDNVISQRLDNYIQMFRGSVGVASISQLVDSAARDGNLAEQKARKLERLMKNLHRATIKGKKYQGTDSDGNGIRTFGGIDYWVDYANTLAGNNFNKVDNNGGAISTGVINDIARRARDINHKIDSIICSHKMKEAINNLKAQKTMYNVMQSERSLDDIVDWINSESGPLTICPTTDVADNVLYFINKDDVEVVPVQGGQFRSFELGKRGSSDELMIEGHYTLVAHLPQSMFKVFDVALA